MNSQTSLRALPWVLSSSFFFALMAGLVKYHSSQYSFLELVFYRSAVGTLLLLPHAISHREWKQARVLKILVLRGVLGFLGLLCYFKAISLLPLSLAGALIYCSPLFVLVFSSFFLKEHVQRKEFLWILLCLSGLALLFQPWRHFGESMDSPALLGLLIGLGGSAFAGAAYTATRQATTHTSSRNIVFFFSALSTGGAFALAKIEGSFRPPQGQYDLWLLLSIGITALLAQILMTEAYRRSAAPLVSALGLLAPLFSILAGLLFFKESLQAIQILGVALLLTGISAISLRKRPRVKNL